MALCLQMAGVKWVINYWVKLVQFIKVDLKLKIVRRLRDTFIVGTCLLLQMSSCPPIITFSSRTISLILLKNILLKPLYISCNAISRKMNELGRKKCQPFPVAKYLQFWNLRFMFIFVLILSRYNFHNFNIIIITFRLFYVWQMMLMRMILRIFKRRPLLNMNPQFRHCLSQVVLQRTENQHKT